MKRIMLVCVMALFLCSTAVAREWYEGGTLHKATVEQYLQGSPADALATANDWVGITISDKAIPQLTMDDIKNGAVAVTACIITATDGVKAVQQMLAFEVAFMCMAQLKNTYPWMLSK